MAVSKVVQGWQAEARAEERRAALLELIEAKFDSIPQQLSAAVQGVTALEALRRWFALAASSATLDQFRQGAQL